MIKFYLLSLLAIVCSVLGVSAQVVTTTPSPLQEDSEDVVIYFHADQGNKGLMGQPSTASLYAHTGVSVIGADGKAADWQYVQADWKTNLPKCKLEYVSTNLWKLNIGDIHSYYGVPSDIKITKLCFVFRGANGSPEGKDIGSTDIFVPVSDKGFQIGLTATVPEGIVNASTGAVTFTVSTTAAASLAITVNDKELKTASGTTTLSASYTFPSEGDYTVTASATNSTGEIKYQTLSYCYAGKSNPAASTAVPAMGATRNADGSVTFCLAAPQKQSAMLVGSWNGYKYTNSQLMSYTDAVQDGVTLRYFTLTLPQDKIARNTTCQYFYVIDGSIKVGDPYAHLVLDPWNDKYIPEDVFPGLPEYPSRLNGIPLAVFNDNLTDYSWQTSGFKAPAKNDLMIYELLLRDFTGTEGKADGNGTVRGAIEKIPYLKSLGINAVELLPINEFNGNISWGYNPNFYFAVDKAYGTPQDYKEFIDKCHAEGIAVILDIVFNQSDGLHPWYMMYAPGQNPFYNRTAPHAYSVLNDWNQGYPLVDRQWKDVLQYWLKEYRVDGFRFDLVKGLGDNSSYPDSGENATNAFNQSRIDRMKKLHGYVREINPDAYFINENLAGADEENKMAADGELNWANVNYAGCQFAMGYSSGSNLNRLCATNDSRTAGSTVSYLESHDEQRLAYKQDKWGAAGVKGNATASCQRLGSAAAQMILVPGSHMIWQFSELGNAQNTKDAEENNNTDPKIVNWNLLNDPNHKGLFESYQQLISLRLGNKDLFTPAQGMDFAMLCNETNWSNGRTITARTADKELYCAINPNVTGSLSIRVPFRNSNNSAYGIYSQSYGCEGSFDAGAGTITVPANCYVVVCSNNVSAVEEPGIDTADSVSVISGKGSLTVSGASGPVEIYDLSGRCVLRTGSDTVTVTLPAGIYIVRSGFHTSKHMVM